MLPIGNRPVIDYVVQDCVRAGITDIYFVVSGVATQLRSFYDRDIGLESLLRSKGNDTLIPLITPPENVRFHYIEQDLKDGRYGTTVPVWLCRDYVDDDELVLIVMGDDVTYSPDAESDIERLVKLGEPAILGLPVPGDDLSSYGVIKVDEAGAFSSIVEKPAPGEAPSHMINVSKYVLPGRFMGCADAAMRAGENESGEYFITDPINDLVEQGTTLHVLEATGTYLDTGTMQAWVKANQWLLENT